MGVLSNRISREELKPGDHIYSWRTAYIYGHHGELQSSQRKLEGVFQETAVSLQNHLTRQTQNSMFILTGIYVGDDMVIHFTRAGGQEIGTGTVLDKILISSSPTPSDTICARCGDQRMLHGVIRSCLDCFLAGGNLYLFEYGVSSAYFVAKARGGTCTTALSDSVDEVKYRATYLLNKGFGVYSLFKNNCEDFTIYCKTGLLVESSYSLGRSGQWASWTAAASTIMSSPLRFLTTSPGGLVLVVGSMYSVGRYVADIGVRRDVVKIPVERLVVEVGGEEHPRAAEAKAGDSM